MKFFKKNQILIYVIALMLVAAGYLNYTSSNHDPKDIVQTTTDAEELAGTGNIGDAQLVNSNVSSETTNSDSIDYNNTDSNNTNSNRINVEGISNEETTNSINESNSDNTKNETIKTNSTDLKNTTKDDYFTKSKLERETMYSQMLETYEKVLNGINSLETQKQSASEEIKKINDTKNGIMICENLIATKGFDKCVIFVNGDSVSVIIGAEDITQEQIAQLQNILSRELNVKIENIHISLK